MSDIITYPENGITYDAEDAAGYLATRQSGVYSAEEDFSVTANGDLTVTVSAGHAWVRPARFRGRSIIMEQPATLTLTAADAVRSRIDCVVLRYDAAAKKTSLTVLEGTPDSSTPTAPAITRTALVYDLCLAQIARPAGSSAVTSADLTDTRLDEELCGIMRDGVTGIPTDQLLQQAQARLDELETPADEYVKDISVSGNTLTLTRGNGQTESFELAEGYTLPAATYSTLGGIKVGTNLSITSAGVLSASNGASIVSQSIGDSISYIRLSNGIQICWGFTSYQYVTFPVPFVNDNSVGFASHASYSGSSRLVTATKSILSTNFLDWIAIGLWK